MYVHVISIQQQEKESRVKVLEQMLGDFEVNFKSDVFSPFSSWQSDEESFTPTTEPDGSQRISTMSCSTGSSQDLVADLSDLSEVTG